MRDYAKRNSRSVKKQSQSDGTGILVFLVICTLLFAGYVTYHLTHENVLTKNTMTAPQMKKSVEHKVIERKVIEHKIIERRKPEKIVEKPIKKSAPMNPADIQPKYDFYKMLPAMTVPIPKDDEPMLPSSLKSTEK